MASKDKSKFDSKIHVYRAARRMTQQELIALLVLSGKKLFGVIPAKG